jgi:TPP-dependent pyruvate/acetoin dehydrogenase alpha subunit
MPAEMLERYMAEKDPVKNFEAWMVTEGLVTEDDIGALEQRIAGEFDAGYEFAQASPFPEAADVTRGLWAEDGYWDAPAPRGGGTEAG